MATVGVLQPPAPIHTAPSQSSQSFTPPAAAATSGNAEDAIPRGTITADLNFYAPPADGSSPHNYVQEPPAGQPRFNFGTNTVPVSINDIRSREADFTLDLNAFQALQHLPPSSPDESALFGSDERIKAEYYPEVTQLILSSVPGSYKVVIFDHTIRRPTTDPSPSARGPVTRVHIDQTAAASAERVRLHCPDEAETLLEGRYRIINVWRPLNGPVLAHPLAFADSATVRDEELVAVEHRYPDRTGYTAGVKHRGDQKWYYWSGMRNDERLLLKCYDSDAETGHNGRVPHTAFIDPRTPEGAPGRESIEVRALVFG